MPEYTATLLLIFIFVTCFYRKHITDWRWFKLGAWAFAGSIALILLCDTLQLWRVLLPNQEFALKKVFSSAGLIASGTALVAGCIKGRQSDAEHLRCLKCGYILKGLSQPRCPECGQAI